MAKRFDDLLLEADDIIEKRASAGNAPIEPVSSEFNKEIDDFASMLEKAAKDTREKPKDEDEPGHNAGAQQDLVNPYEKIAHACAVLDTLDHLEHFVKLAQFEEQAKAAGHSEEKIAEFLEKKAAESPTNPAIAKYLALAASAGLGAYAGHRSGKRKGYDQALKDVNDAFGAQAAG